MTMSAVLDRLRQPLRRGEVEDLRGLTIEEPLELEGALLPNVDFSGTTFAAPVALRGCRVPGPGLVHGLRPFNAPVNFSAAMFLSDARFDQARFRAARPSPAPNSAASPASTAPSSAMRRFSIG